MRCILLAAALCSVAVAQDPLEPDDSAGEATVIDNPFFVEGREFPDGADEDWYRFTLSEPSAIVAETLHRVPDGGRIEIELFDDTVSSIEFDSDSFLMDLDAGTYYFKTTLQPEPDGAIEYSFGFAAYPYRDDAFEPNDTANASVQIETGRFYRGLTMAPQDDDWFEITVPAKGVSRRVIVQANSPVQSIEIEVFELGGDPAINDFGDTWISGVLAPGQYRIELENYDGVFAVPTYDLICWFPDVADPYEDDDTMNTANRLAVRGAGHTRFGQQQLHNLLPAGDEDWYRFRIERAENFAFRAEGWVGPSPIVEVFDVQGNPVNEAEPLSAVIFNPPDGEYFARVTSEGTPNPGDFYVVEVNSIPIPRLTQGSLIGFVAGNTKGTALTEANITIDGVIIASATTDENGLYTFDAVPQGSYSIRANAPGYGSVQISRNIGPAITTLDFDLDPQSNATDLNGDGSTNSLDIQRAINGVLGTGPSADVNNDGTTNSVDIQLVINAVLGV